MIYKESQIQKQIVNAVRLLYPKSLLFSVPNEARRSKATGGILKASGMVSGVSDLIFIHKGNVVFFEVKTETGKQAESQKLFEENITKQGFKYFVVRSANETLNIIVTLNTL